MFTQEMRSKIEDFVIALDLSLPLSVYHGSDLAIVDGSLLGSFVSESRMKNVTKIEITPSENPLSSLKFSSTDTVLSIDLTDLETVRYEVVEDLATSKKNPSLTLTYRERGGIRSSVILYGDYRE